jgi:hypothetical protein
MLVLLFYHTVTQQQQQQQHMLSASVQQQLQRQQSPLKRTQQIMPRWSSLPRQAGLVSLLQSILLSQQPTQVVLNQ